MFITAFTSPASLPLVVSYEAVNTVTVKSCRKKQRCEALCWLMSSGTDEYEKRAELQE
jgi:hypothetical protein